MPIKSKPIKQNLTKFQYKLGICIKIGKWVWNGFSCCRYLVLWCVHRSAGDQTIARWDDHTVPPHFNRQLQPKFVFAGGGSPGQPNPEVNPSHECWTSFRRYESLKGNQLHNIGLATFATSELGPLRSVCKPYEEMEVFTWEYIKKIVRN